MSNVNIISKKRKFIKDGLFQSEVNEFLRRILAEDGYAGVQIKPTPTCTQVVVKCTSTQEVVKRIPCLQKLLELRFKFKPDQIKVFAEKVQARGLSARAQAQSICFKLKGGLAVRRACYGVLKYIMDNGRAKGVRIIISGKLRGQRAKAMKFQEGYMISSGDATNDYIVEAVEHVMLRQGTIGVRVTIMLPYDEEGKNGGCMKPLPDHVKVIDPKSYDDDVEDNRPQPSMMTNTQYPTRQPQEQQTDQGPPQQQQPPQDFQTPGGPSFQQPRQPQDQGFGGNQYGQQQQQPQQFGQQQQQGGMF